MAAAEFIPRANSGSWATNSKFDALDTAPELSDVLALTGAGSQVIASRIVTEASKRRINVSLPKFRVHPPDA